MSAIHVEYIFVIMSVYRGPPPSHCGSHVLIDVRNHACLQGGRLARLASLGSLGARVYCGVQCSHSCSYLCLYKGRGLARLYCGVHGDFLNQFRKSRDVYLCIM